jgi:hypothetical protein
MIFPECYALVGVCPLRPVSPEIVPRAGVVCSGDRLKRGRYQDGNRQQQETASNHGWDAWIGCSGAGTWSGTVCL